LYGVVITVPNELKRHVDLLYADADSVLTDEGWLGLTLWLTEAIVSGDADGLDEATNALQWRLGRCDPDGDVHTEEVGRLKALTDVAVFGYRTAVPAREARSIGGGTHAHAFLHAISKDPGITSQDLEQVLGLSTDEVSRVGRQLREAGMADNRRLGRNKSWELTPSGREHIEMLGAYQELHPVRSFSIPSLYQSVSRLLDAGHVVLYKGAPPRTEREPERVNEVPAAGLVFPEKAGFKPLEPAANALTLMQGRDE